MKPSSLLPTSYFLRARRKGQILVESLVALGILTTGFLGMLALVSRSIGLNRVVSENYTATYLAAEGIEVMKNLLDSTYLEVPPAAWASGVCSGGSSNTYKVTYETTRDPGSLQTSDGQFLNYDETRGYQYGPGDPTPFKREVEVNCLSHNGSIDEVQVNSVVSWTTRGGGQFSVNLEDHFLDWNTGYGARP